MCHLLSCVGVVSLGAMALVIAGCGSGGDPSDFVMSVDHPNIGVMADYTTPPITLSVKAINSFHSTVELTASPPPGLSCNPTCTITIVGEGDDPSSAVFHFDTEPNLAGATSYPIVFHGVEGAIEHDLTVSVAVTAWNGVAPPPDFDFTVSPTLFYASIPPRKNIPFNDEIRYMFTFARYNHYTGPISVVAAPTDPDTFCSSAACSLVETADTFVAPFIISTDENPGRHITLFTASVAPYVTRTATAQIDVYAVPISQPPLPGGPLNTKDTYLPPPPERNPLR